MASHQCTKCFATPVVKYLRITQSEEGYGMGSGEVKSIKAASFRMQKLMFLGIVSGRVWRNQKP